MKTLHIFLTVVLSIIGMGYAFSGKRHGNMTLLGCGLALGLFPYFVDNTLAMLGIGAALVGWPLFNSRS